jgi:hypothetical protein
MRVEAELDASKYAAGARQKAQADQKMVESGEKVATSVDQTQRRLGESSTAVERLSRSVDPAYNASQRLGTGSRHCSAHWILAGSRPIGIRNYWGY